MIETQVLIQEIQKKHQITLKPDDPVFVAVTLNDLLLSHYLDKFQALLEAQNRLVASEGIERLNQASSMGCEMINRSLEALSQTLESNRSQVVNQIMTLVDLKSPEFKKRSDVLNWSLYTIIACSFFVLGAMFKSFFYN